MKLQLCIHTNNSNFDVRNMIAISIVKLHCLLPTRGMCLPMHSLLRPCLYCWCQFTLELYCISQLDIFSTHSTFHSFPYSTQFGFSKHHCRSDSVTTCLVRYIHTYLAESQPECRKNKLSHMTMLVNPIKRNKTLTVKLWPINFKANQ